MWDFWWYYPWILQDFCNSFWDLHHLVLFFRFLCIEGTIKYNCVIQSISALCCNHWWFLLSNAIVIFCDEWFYFNLHWINTFSGAKVKYNVHYSFSWLKKPDYYEKLRNPKFTNIYIISLHGSWFEAPISSNDINIKDIMVINPELLENSDWNQRSIFV